MNCKKELHLSNGYRSCRAHARAGLASLAEIRLMGICLSIFHLKYLNRAVIYTLLATFTLFFINCYYVHETNLLIFICLIGIFIIYNYKK